MANNKKHATCMTCQHCGASFEDRSSGTPRRYCSHKCKSSARVAKDRLRRAEVNARARDWYHNRGGKELTLERNKRPEIAEYRRFQARLYKARHPEKIAEWTTGYRERRNKRVADQSDGTAGRMISELMKLASCQYCGYKFNGNEEKRIDHREPISLGGAHSAINLELCCEKCNLAKAAKSFDDWVLMLPQPFRKRAIARAEKARGAPLAQDALPLFGGAVIKQKKDNGIDPAKARAEAFAAWHKWLHDMAADEWLDGYYKNHPKPWTDHRLTKSQSFYSHYKADPEFARRWNDRRNKRRKMQRAQKKIMAIKG